MIVMGADQYSTEIAASFTAAAEEIYTEIVGKAPVLQ